MRMSALSFFDYDVLMDTFFFSRAINHWMFYSAILSVTRKGGKQKPPRILAHSLLIAMCLIKLKTLDGQVVMGFL